MTCSLAPRDLDLLETLTRCVPVLAVRQAAQLGWHEARRRGAARERLRRLARAGWIELRTVNAHPPLAVDRPIFAWHPGDDDPNPYRLARQVQSRWSNAARPTEVCFATRETAALFGSTASGGAALAHLDHDLLLAEVYLHYRLHRPLLAEQWIGEHALPKAGYRIKDPDAFLRDAQGLVLRVIESAGRYSAPQVESIHEHCADNRLSYELW